MIIDYYCQEKIIKFILFVIVWVTIILGTWYWIEFRGELKRAFGLPFIVVGIYIAKKCKI